MTYDYIIVGAGSAGCILASRLTDSGKYSVLLLEAGGTDHAWRFKVPVGYVFTYYDEKSNWMYYSEAEKELGGRKMYVPRGKVLGGSGSINALVYVRGQPSDFDDWAAGGNAGWSFEEVLPYFKKIESHPLGDTPYHGSDGPIRITRTKDRIHPVCTAFLDACDSLGYARNDDFNGASLEGAGVYDINTRGGLRDASSRAYLRPALRRPQLRFVPECLVEKILFEGNRAKGVRFRRAGVVQECFAAREVILSAGAVGTPKLLQLSGVGDGELLQRHGIAVTHHAPAVGQNLQDHLCVSYYYRANRRTLNDDYGRWLGRIKAGLQFMLLRAGPLSLSVNQAGGFFRSTPAQRYANLQVYFNPLSYEIPKEKGQMPRPKPYSGFLLAASSCRPSSRGSVEIASGRVADPPLIRPNFLTTQHDIDEAIQGSLLIRKLVNAPALADLTVEETDPGRRVSSEADMLQYFRQNSGSIYHLCGSCAMGASAATSVVSNRLQAHGLAGLRIADASIFPNVTSGNINAPTMMVAEKAAAMILEDAVGT
jgi:choline dehydrogenase